MAGVRPSIALQGNPARILRDPACLRGSLLCGLNRRANGTQRPCRKVRLAGAMRPRAAGDTNKVSEPDDFWKRGTLDELEREVFGRDGGGETSRRPSSSPEPINDEPIINMNGTQSLLDEMEEMMMGRAPDGSLDPNPVVASLQKTSDWLVENTDKQMDNKTTAIILGLMVVGYIALLVNTLGSLPEAP